MRELPEKLPREKAAELLKRALDSIFVHYVHADTASRTCIVHVVELDAALAVPALGLRSIFRDWLVVVCCELSSVIIGFSPASTEDTASLILVTNGPRRCQCCQEHLHNICLVISIAMQCILVFI